MALQPPWLPLHLRQKSKQPKNCRVYLWDKQRGVCPLCLRDLGAEPDSRLLHVDHILPIGRGGTNSLANLRLTHAACNMERGMRVEGDAWDIGIYGGDKMAIGLRLTPAHIWNGILAEESGWTPPTKREARWWLKHEHVTGTVGRVLGEVTLADGTRWKRHWEVSGAVYYQPGPFTPMPEGRGPSGPMMQERWFGRHTWIERGAACARKPRRNERYREVGPCRTRGRTFRCSW
jgi:hypothetical protein